MKKTIRLINYSLLGLLFLNLLIFSLLDIGLNDRAKLIIKIAYFVSGIIAFFFYLKPFTKLTLYFSYFAIGPILGLLAWLADGIMGAIVISFYFWLLPNSAVYSNNDFIIYRKSEGPLGRGDKYELYEKLWFLENKIASFENVDFIEITPEDIRIIHKNHNLYVYNKGSMIYTTFYD